MECCGPHYAMPMHDGCRPKCKRRCVHEFTKKFKVYETCCYEVVKVCPVCSCEHQHPMCPRCGGYGQMDFGMGYGGGHGMGYGY